MQNNSLIIDGKNLNQQLHEVETPSYIYFPDQIKKNISEYRSALKEAGISNYQIHYAVKANPNKAILDLIHKEGIGLDIVSEGELELGREAGFSENHFIFSGVGKTAEELTKALTLYDSPILAVNVESQEELEELNLIAKNLKRKANVGLRFNPNISPETHQKISTSSYETKFGMDEETILKIFELKDQYNSVNLLGLSIHVGSQIQTMNDFLSGYTKLFELCQKIGKPLEFIDLGGGIGIDYHHNSPKKFSLKLYFEQISSLLKKYVPQTDKPLLIFEPGRSIVGNAGIFVSKVIRTKSNPNKNFMIIDGAMNDLIRPSLYNAYHEVYPLYSSNETKEYDLVGPVCETGDILAKERTLPIPKAGDRILLADAGAYGYTMASRYNSRKLPKEYLCNGDLIEI